LTPIVDVAALELTERNKAEKDDVTWKHKQVSERFCFVDIYSLLFACFLLFSSFVSLLVDGAQQDGEG
jgi:hypothetical protein